MDMLEQGLDGSSHDKTNDSTNSDDVVQLSGHSEEEPGEEQAAAIASVAHPGGISLDPTVQYQFRTDTGGQVTYRVVQVADNAESQSQVVTGFPAGTQVAQAVIQSPFSNGGSPTTDLSTSDARFTYVPTVSAAGDGSHLTDVNQAALQQVAGAGQFYVMMSPQDVLQGQRTIAPRTQSFSPKIEGGNRTGRDERRRATHNEVERRRRDKINNWIVQLSKQVPDCCQDHTKQGQVRSASSDAQSKGGILSKACDYINELRTANTRMAESLKDTERLAVDVELLRQQCDELKQENALLRAHMQQHGIVPPDLPHSV